MKLWRISNYQDLAGIGGIKTAARWHNKGIPVVYLSESPALAMLEVLVHFELAPDEVPTQYQLLEIDYQGQRGISRLDESALPPNWREDENITRAIGDEWLSGLKGALLRVPSAIVANSYNFLLNPRHELAVSATIVGVQPQPFDTRLLVHE